MVSKLLLLCFRDMAEIQPENARENIQLVRENWCKCSWKSLNIFLVHPDKSHDSIFVLTLCNMQALDLIHKEFGLNSITPDDILKESTNATITQLILRWYLEKLREHLLRYPSSKSFNYYRLRTKYVTLRGTPVRPEAGGTTEDTT